ncbi:hypothetical protein PPERSA_08649 [Pseudocohnilembus persalinus]|uniref:Uncharacterized protein n=1 Tax=Pseudocohnilembus persalinus TaxID=266149 RepID=A0A0V0R6R6_PSEPJ|nr:hypothetical protein PPERSA_08649 [Pseudocohnilembus persalinus]|eukprot:KRX10191.1 hypothetical protein PPERSA_08649 [Pseudocohnilembus persalinus]
MAGNFIGIFAIICSLASLAWTLITLVYWVLLTIKNRKELIYDDPEQDLILKINNKLFKIRILWNYLNVFLKKAYLQPVLMYIRKFLFPLFLICFNQYLDVAILPFILIYNLVYIGYFIVYQPLQEKIQNYRQIISEILHLLSYIPLMFLAFNDSSDFAKQINYSRFYIIVAIVFLAFNDAFLAYHFIISPIYKKIKSSVPKIENLYQAQDLRAETPLSTQKPKKRKEISNLALNDELESLRDSQTKLQTPQILQESAGGFDVARRKIMRQRHKINNANIKNSRTQKNLPTTLINESTRVTSRKK